jgi:hypothetical protein
MEPMITQAQPLAKLTQSQQPIQTRQLIAESPVERPSAWMRDGQSPAEITLAAAILTAASLWGVALVIMAIAHLMKVLVPNNTPTSPK